MSNSILTEEQLAVALANHQPQFIPALPGRTNHLEAAVMIPLFWGDCLQCVATLRPQSMGRHAGEVCFPGGRVDSGDLDLMETAQREQAEELGVFACRILGSLSSIPLYTSDYRIKPFVCALDTSQISPCPREVVRPLWFSIGSIFELPYINGFVVKVGATSKVSPVLIVDGELMFGATAYALLELLSVIALQTGKVLPPIKALGYRWDYELLRPVAHVSDK